VDAFDAESVDDGIEPREVVGDRRDRLALDAETDVAHEVDGVHRPPAECVREQGCPHE
jgi:hypothetical protein